VALRRDYGQEAIEIVLQVMENQRNDLGGLSRATAIGWQPSCAPTRGCSRRLRIIWISLTTRLKTLEEIAQRMLVGMPYRLSPPGLEALTIEGEDLRASRMFP
jgi:hypothetical protein